jgi:DNA-binding HxlR family transcriptional regulator
MSNAGSTRGRKRRSDCPISISLDIFGDRWSLLILRDIMFYNRTRFSDFAPREHIATNILTDRLHRLEDEGIIEKHQDSAYRNQYLYQVTGKGKELLPALIELTLWGLQYDPQSLASSGFVKRAQTEKRSVVREMVRSIERGEFTEYRRKEIGIPG